MKERLTPFERQIAGADLASALAELDRHHARLARLASVLTQLAAEIGADLEAAARSAKLLAADAGAGPYVVPMHTGTLPGEADEGDDLADLDRELSDAQLTEAALYAVKYDLSNGTMHVDLLA